MTSNYTGLIFGVKDGKVLIQHEKSKLPNRNVAVAGGPGSFKTQSFVLSNVINNTDCSIVVTDPKGEVYEKTAKIKEAQGYQVRVVNFKHMSLSDHYNPFGYVRKNLDATTVANTIVSAKNDPKKKDVWFNAQLGLLKSLILYAKLEFHPSKRNMEGVLDFLQEFDPEANEDGESELDEKFMALDKKHPARRSYELGFKKSQEKTRGSIIISLLTTIGDYVDDEVAEFTSSNDFFFEDLGKKKIALYVLIPTMDKTWEGLINLFFTQMFQELYLLGDKHGAKLPIPVVFLLDEFPNLGKFDSYEEFLATCRGYRISCCTIFQNYTQLMDKYGKEKAESILGNCAIKICLGNVNETTAKYFSDIMGKTTVKVDTGSSSLSKGKSGSSSSSQSYNYTGRMLMNPDEITTMNKKTSLVLLSGKSPIKCEKAFQFALFPNLVEQYEVSQMDYERKISTEAKEQFEKDVQEYESKVDYDNISDSVDEENLEKQHFAEEEQESAYEDIRNNLEEYKQSLAIINSINSSDEEEEEEEV
ncbi:VirD4-like conjugal transfer protein, CD1115 family [Bacillus subtilis]|uniref:VirD4-like conjugal transfer protein, CD1115 family n=1 Tax=Bacillus subtilis TaxID=1423 RepID=UPI000EF24633|nr:type IV secretory system conjugative DNA transfer family protein [Bacillus subtilis]AYK68271.1 conjugal transfer protein [Bacillus subtilis subsp. subtilis]MDO3655338.1 type IV secretory system conjugative DNA transfer family protein [Bacillus subtilis]